MKLTYMKEQLELKVDEEYQRLSAKFLQMAHVKAEDPQHKRDPYRYQDFSEVADQWLKGCAEELQEYEFEHRDLIDLYFKPEPFEFESKLYDKIAGIGFGEKGDNLRLMLNTLSKGIAFRKVHRLIVSDSIHLSPNF
jgi:hypothetical protein